MLNSCVECAQKHGLIMEKTMFRWILLRFLIFLEKLVNPPGVTKGFHLTNGYKFDTLVFIIIFLSFIIDILGSIKVEYSFKWYV